MDRLHPSIQQRVYYSDLFKQVHFSKHLAKVDQYSPRITGNERWDTGEWSATIQVQSQNGDPIQLKGYFGCIDIREGDDWKIRMLTYNMTWRREWDSNPRILADPRFSRPVL
jgi:hypothetical protein